jgi:hypothetical protein
VGVEFCQRRLLHRRRSVKCEGRPRKRSCKAGRGSVCFLRGAYCRVISSQHGKPVIERCGRHTRRNGLFRDGLRHGLCRRIFLGAPSQRGRLLLELLRREQFWHHARAHAHWRGLIVLERPERGGMAVNRSRRAIYSGRCNRQSAHLFSADKFVQHASHADPAGGRLGADCTSDPTTG